MLYRDFVFLLLCYIVRSYVIVVLCVHGCVCAGVRTRNKRRLECSCSMLALFYNFVLGFFLKLQQLKTQFATKYISTKFIKRDCRRNQTLPVITAFSSKLEIKYGTEKYVCVKPNNMDKFNKKRALPLDSVP